MKVRLLGAAAALGMSAVLAGAPAAQATPASPQVSPLDLSVAGHVSGTVTTTAPWVGVTTGAEAVVLPTNAGSMSFDLLTWGLGSANLQVFACNDPGTTDCAPPVSVPFTATDVVPQVTWPADVTIGAGQDASVTIADPQGGGRIMAAWEPGYNTGYYDVDRNGTSPLYLTDGTGQAELFRCDVDPGGPCTPFVPAQKIDLAVRRTTQATIALDPANRFNGAISTRQPTVKRQLWTATTDQLPFTFTWHLEQGGVPVAGTEDSATGNVSAAGWVPFDVSADGLPDGSYAIKGTLTLHHPDFGDIVGATTGNGTVVVDRTAPTFASTSQSVATIYPYVGAYGHAAAVRFSLTGVVGGSYLEIHDPADQPVAKVSLTRSSSTATVWKATWGGTSDATHKVVAAGSYTAYIMDSAGNVGATVGSVTVSTKKLVTKTFTKTVQAAGSTVSKYVGKCSTLKRPVRGWTGSQGYYANTRCGTQTSAASEVHTVHQMKLPSAVAYKAIHVTTYGGSAASRPGSQGAVLYLSTSRRFFTQWIASPQTGNHAAPDVSPSRYVWSDHYFVWAFATGLGNRYDVKSFTVVLKYVVLV